MIYLFLAEGFEMAEAIVPLDVMRRAGLDVRTVSVGKERTVCSSGKVGIIADMTFDETVGSLPGAVVLPGGMPGTNNLNVEKVRKVLLECYENGGTLGAICAAPIILGDLGLLEGREAICYPGHEARLRGARLSEKKVVRDGRIITAAGMGAALEFGLALVSALKCPGEAERIRTAVRA